MFNIIVTGHSTFASGIKGSINLICGEQENVYYVDFKGNSTDELKNDLNNAILSISKKGADTLILCDLLGGSPFHTSVELKTENSDKTIEVIAGANLSMIIEAISEMDDSDVCRFSRELVSSGKDSIALYEFIEKSNNEIYDDGI